jgi:hypothetical protein
MMAWPSRALALLALAGMAGAVVALLLDPHGTLAAWLAAIVAASAVPVGALPVLLISYLVRGRWTNALHLPLTAASLLIPVAAVLFIPVLVGMPWLYPWVDRPPAAAFKAVWLTPWFFALRAILYFAVWSAIAWWARRAWGDPQRMIRVASAGLILYALTASLAGVDWIESLNPDFHSSIYGLLVLTFQVLAGLSFAIALGTRAQADIPPGYGGLLLATLLLWAYIHAMQYIIIWAGNIPDEVVWYLRRETGVWLYVLWALMVLQFVVPFFAMLLDRVRNRPFPLFVIACGTLALRFVEAFVLVLPSAQAQGAVLWLAVPAAVAATIGILGVALQLTLARMERSSADMMALPAAG